MSHSLNEILVTFNPTPVSEESVAEATIRQIISAVTANTKMTAGVNALYYDENNLYGISFTATGTDTITINVNAPNHPREISYSFSSITTSTTFYVSMHQSTNEKVTWINISTDSTRKYSYVNVFFAEADGSISIFANRYDSAPKYFNETDSYTFSLPCSPFIPDAGRFLTSIAKMPDLINNKVFDELSLALSINNTSNSYTNYVSFAGEIYRLIPIYPQNGGASEWLAFPVSDPVTP